MFSLIKSTYLLFDSKDKKLFFSLIFLSFIAMITEIFGLSLIIPVVSVILNENIYGLNSHLDKILLFFENPTRDFILYFFLSVFIFFYLFKSIFSTYLIFKQNSFLSFFKVKITKLIFETYLYKDYSFFLEVKSSIILRNIRRETDLFLDVVVQAIMVIITEFLIVIGILSLLLYFQPLGSLAIFFVILITVYLHRLFTKKITYKYGKKRQNSEAACIEVVQQSLSSIIIVKLKKIEPLILKKFTYFANEEADSQRFQATMQEIPRLWLELVAVIGLVIFIILMQSQSYSTTHVISTLAIFAAASFKILPSMNRIFTNMQKLRYGKPIMEAINLIYSDYQKENNLNKTDTLKNNNDKDESDSKNFIQINNLEFKYKNQNSHIFSSLNFNFKKNQKIGIIGDSGSGKSTLIHLILGLLKPDQGEVLFNSTNIENIKNQYHKKIDYVPQNTYLSNDTILNNLIFGYTPDTKVDMDKIDKILSILDLKDFVNNLPDKLNTVISENSLNISGGQKQRISLARALYYQPDFLILDESTSALDEFSKLKIIENIFSYPKIKNILMVTHDLKSLQYCDKVYEIKNKNITEIK